MDSLITHRLSLEELPDMLGKMRDRSEFYNKVMLISRARADSQ
jgi:hypothetical protein